uniref:Succinate:cytochrome c oxidoreductase subunit 3 n=1 Tax=Pyropia suborbiculata TaxID=1185355 RepID=H3JS51_PORCA|nr:succinate:cytochrome c oxidoreductase subunit 3 [Pyropia suborbiculata]
MYSINRPVSPHLTVYNPQRSSICSIWHRISGVIMFVLIFSPLLLLNYTYFSYSNSLSTSTLFYYAITDWLLFSCRLMIMSIFLYHTTNGVRHFLWDSVVNVNTKRMHKDSSLLLVFVFINMVSQLYLEL